MTTLDARNLTKFFGLRPVLRGVSLTVARGEFVAVLGANGAGKTTLLRMLATLSTPTSGALFVDGVDALKQPERARARIGVVSHQSLVYPDLTAFENLRFHAELHGATHARIEDALRRVDLWARAHDPARTFSRGMIQRLTIARATVHDPGLLLLDEPFTGLDQPSAANLSVLLREAAGAGRAVVMTTHEFGRGLDGLTRAVAIRDGRIGGELTAGIDAASLGALLHGAHR
jgi:heme exporter protein A